METINPAFVAGEDIQKGDFCYLEDGKLKVMREASRKREPDSDLQSAFENNPQDDLKLEDIDDVLACIPGANDEYNWHWIVLLKSGDYAYIKASCDYTGWDCQSSLEWHDCTMTFHGSTAKGATVSPQMDDEYGSRKGKIANQLLNQLMGLQPYGMYDDRL